MSLDVEEHLGAVERTVSSPVRHGPTARAVTLTRIYATTIENLWDAVTSARRIPRWFMPIGGELKLGGRYHLQENASGVITACEPPSHLALTWEFADDVSWLELQLVGAGGRQVRLALTHTAHHSNHWSTYGPGAAGVGWELGLLGLAVHLENPDVPKLDEASFAASPDGRAFICGSSLGWEKATIDFGTDPEAARAAAKRTTAFYTGDSF